MQTTTPARPSGFPVDTLQNLRRLANLTARYTDRVCAEKDDYTRERNYKYALRCIFRIQKTLYETEHAIQDKEARAKVAKISDALFNAWYYLADRRPYSDSNLLGTLAGLAVDSVDNFELYKTSFDCILSELKQRTK